MARRILTIVTAQRQAQRLVMVQHPDRCSPARLGTCGSADGVAREPDDDCGTTQPVSAPGVDGSSLRLTYVFSKMTS